MAEPSWQKWWKRTPLGGLFSVCGAGTGKMNRRLDPARPAWTQTATPNLFHWRIPRHLTHAEAVRVQGFPDDFDFRKQKAGYVCGMSVPPPMMQRVATEVAKMLDRKTELPPLVTGPWTLEDLRQGRLGRPAHGMTVFSCFHCGGGSTMGYKLAGYSVLGGVEIDKDMMEIYRANHRPDARFSFQMPIQDFKALPDGDIPQELFKLDVLDGSPPCSSFSMAGAREDKWSESHKFREGQADQVLDDLFFHFIDLAARLRPRAVVAENVKGLIMGNARGYVKEIFAAFEKAGYEAQLFLLNASRMGVPQRRERTFFIARRKDLGLGKISLSFEEEEIPVARAFQGIENVSGRALTPNALSLWSRCRPGDALSSVHPRGHCFNLYKLHPGRPAPTQLATSRIYHWRDPRTLLGPEAARLQGFPDDFNYVSKVPSYVCGMSVPPPMMQRVGVEILRQLLAPAEASPALSEPSQA